MINKFLLIVLFNAGSNAFLASCAQKPNFAGFKESISDDAESKEPAVVEGTKDGKVVVSTPLPNDKQDPAKGENNTGSQGSSKSENNTANQGPKTDSNPSQPEPVTPDKGENGNKNVPKDEPKNESQAELIKKKCTPEVEYVSDNSPGAKKFGQYVPDPKLAMIQAGHYVCSVLYKNVSEVPPVTKVKLVLEAKDGVAYVTGAPPYRELHISTKYLNGVGAATAKLDIDGIMIHENAHIWQLGGKTSDRGLIEGVADYVRASGNWYPPGSRNRKGGVYNDAYTTSAYFLGWLNSKYPDFAYKFNLAMKNILVPASSKP